MSNDKESNVYERLWKLWAMVCKMIMDGVRDPEKVAEVLQTIVDGVAGLKAYLSRLFPKKTITIAATDGTETFESSELFTGGIYGVTLPTVEKPIPTAETTAIVYEQILDGKFTEVFGSLGETRLRFQNQGQVIAFCRDHRDKLRTDGYATFFELEGGFVAFVYFDDDGRLKVSVSPFSYDRVWGAESRRRFVVPQQ